MNLQGICALAGLVVNLGLGMIVFFVRAEVTKSLETFRTYIEDKYVSERTCNARMSERAVAMQPQRRQSHSGAGA
jgi:hypothetical protein